VQAECVRYDLCLNEVYLPYDRRNNALSSSHVVMRGDLYILCKMHGCVRQCKYVKYGNHNSCCKMMEEEREGEGAFGTAALDR
jgi:hypothetical protein